jgi:hypothetical protein
MGLPMVVEIVDTEEKIQEFLVAAEEIIGPGLITLERVQAIFYKGEFPEQRVSKRIKACSKRLVSSRCHHWGDLAAVSENLRPFQGNESASHHLFQFR